jgi:hypothetical protein
MVKLTIDDLIDTFVRLNSQSDVVSELGEQDTSGGDSGPTTPSPTKWDSQYQIKRGPANQIKVTKWKESYPIKRGVANTLF